MGLPVNMRLTVATKIGGLVALLIVLLVVIAVYSIVQFRNLGRQVDVIVDRDFQIARGVTRIGLLSKDRLQLVRDMVSLAIQNREHDLALSDQQLELITQEIEGEIATIRLLAAVDQANPDARSLETYEGLLLVLGDVEQQSSQFRTISDGLFVNLENDIIGASIRSIDDLAETSEQVVVFLNELTTETERSSRETQIGITDLENRSIRLIAVTSGGTIMLAIVLSVVVIIRIRTSLRALSTRARLIETTVSDNDFIHADIKVRSDDEIGDLSKALNAMSLKLSETLRSHREAQIELTAARDRAAEADKAKSAFLANMSHELRTPLNAIIGYSEMLMEEAVDSGNESASKDLTRISTAGRVLLAMINDVLDISKIEAGRMDVFPEPTNVTRVAEMAVEMVQPLATQNSNRLTLDVENDPGVILTDSIKLRQILFNLLSNAAKFTRDGQISLIVRTSQQPDHPFLEFRVVDNGIGMSPSQMDRIFDDFVQADNSIARNFGGTGLGLSISRRFAEILGGEITVASAVGDGSTFTLRLPITGHDHTAIAGDLAQAGVNE